MLTYAERYLAAADAAHLRPALERFSAWLGENGLAEGAVTRPDLDRFLYALALDGANSATLDQAVLALKGYFACRAREAGAPDPAADLGLFGETDGQRERYIKTEWSMADAFYGIPQEKRRDGDA